MRKQSLDGSPKLELITSLVGTSANANAQRWKFRPTRRHIGIQMERKQTTEDEDVTGLLVYLCKTNEPLTPLFPSFSLLSDPTRIVLRSSNLFIR